MSDDDLTIPPEWLDDSERLYECIGGPLNGQWRPVQGLNSSIYLDRELGTHEYVLVERGGVRIGPALYYNGRVPAP